MNKIVDNLIFVFHRGCQDAIDNFLIEEKSRIREEESRKKKLEEDGEYEVSRIMDVQILDGGTDFFFSYFINSFKITYKSSRPLSSLVSIVSIP